MTRRAKPQQSSMTKRLDNVEPPLASHQSQVTILVLATIVLSCLLVVGWRDVPVSNVSGDPVASWSAESVLRIDLNAAEPRELALLPGVGSILAERIAQNRVRCGPFATVDDLVRVHGIGPKTLSQIRDICVVGPALAEVPGGDRWASTRDDPQSRQADSFDPVRP